MHSPDAISWYAVKIYAELPRILKYLQSNGVEIFAPKKDGKPMFGPIIFLRCTENDLLKVKADWYHQMVVCRDPEREYPQPIADHEMENFRMVLSAQNQELYPLEIYDREFLVGQGVRVTDGPFKGARGVIKRIKGNRRLIVSVCGIVAVATSYIPQEFLESIV